QAHRGRARPAACRPAPGRVACHRCVGDGQRRRHGPRSRRFPDAAGGEGGGRDVRGRWAAGIAPRNFAWVIRDHLAVSERPGGYARNHRRVRRQEEIIWLREQGFTLVVSLLGSPHNLHAYDEMDLRWAHFPFGPTAGPRVVLPDLYAQLEQWLAEGQRMLVH